MAPVTAVPSALVRVTDVSVPPLTEARTGTIGLTPAEPEAGVRVTVAGGAAGVLAELPPVDAAEPTGRDDVAVVLTEVEWCPAVADVHPASAQTAAVMATTRRAPAATVPSEVTTTHADGAGHFIVTIRSARSAQRHITIGSR
jgi:hypothetical protein